MDKSEMISAKLREFRKRAGLSMTATAKAIGLAGASSWQRYENPVLLPDEFLGRDVVVKLEKAFVGKGSPPIERDEVWALAGPEFATVIRTVEEDEEMILPARPKPNASFPPQFQQFDTSRKIPLMGQSEAGPNGKFIMNGQKIADIFCPPGLENVPNAYAVRVYGTSMEPRYRAGETVWLNPQMPVSAGDDVVVQLRPETDGDEMASYIKEFRSRSSKVLRLWQHNPEEGEEHEINIDNGDVFSVHVVVYSTRYR